MKVMIVLASALALAACGQTTGSARRAPPAKETQLATLPAKSGTPQQTAERCAQAANKMAETHTKAAMLGGALNMVGGLGGRGGMVVAQAASVGGQVVQSQAQAKAQSQMQQECM